MSASAHVFALPEGFSFGTRGRCRSRAWEPCTSRTCSSPIPGIRVTPCRWRKRRKRSEDRGEALAGPHHASKHKRSSVGGVAEMLAVGARQQPGRPPIARVADEPAAAAFLRRRSRGWLSHSRGRASDRRSRPNPSQYGSRSSEARSPAYLRPGQRPPMEALSRFRQVWEATGDELVAIAGSGGGFRGSSPFPPPSRIE